MIFAVFDVLLTTCRRLRLYKLQFFTFIFATNNTAVEQKYLTIEKWRLHGLTCSGNALVSINKVELRRAKLVTASWWERIPSRHVTIYPGQFSLNISPSPIQWIPAKAERQKSWQWVTFCDPWPMWPISQLTLDPHDPWPMTQSQTWHESITTTHELWWVHDYWICSNIIIIITLWVTGCY